MRKRIFSSALAVLSTVVLCACLCLKPDATKPAPQTYVESVAVVIAPAEDVSETVKANVLDEAGEIIPTYDNRSFTEEELAVRFTNMLNLNYCYNGNFQNNEMLAVCCAVSLSDYASDIPGYGIGVGQSLVSGFAADFYGKSIDFDALTTELSADGYVMTPSYAVGTQSHTIVSMTETESGYEIVSQLEIYYGGDDCEVLLATSVFEASASSEFGFRLISCNLA